MSRLWLGLLVVLLVAGAVLSRGMGFTSRRTPLPLEPAVARSALRWATPSAIASAANPVKNSPEVRRDGNGALGRPLRPLPWQRRPRNAAGLVAWTIPPAPDMTAPATEELSDGELFYMIPEPDPVTGSARAG